MMATTADKSRFESCWGISSCHECIQEKAGCGWCPYTRACVPASTLLDPIRNEEICPYWAERWELRTKAFGCGCSTTTILSIIVTIFATIAGLVILFGIGLVIKRINPFLGTGQMKGTEIEVKNDGTRDQRQWERDNWSKWLYRLFARPDLKSQSEQEAITERSRLLG